MPILSPDDLDKLRRRQIANIIKKQNDGKTLTAREERQLADAAINDAGNFARTYEELASRIGVTRQTIYNVQKKFPHDWPKPRADGRHEINAWIAFFNDHDIARGQFSGGCNDDLKETLLREQIRKLKLANDALEKQLVPIDEVFSVLRPTLSAFRTSLDNLAHRAALKLGDYQETVQVLQTEVDIALRTFQGAAWFDEQVEVNIAPLQVDTSDIPPADGQIKPKGKPGRKPKAQ